MHVKTMHRPDTPGAIHAIVPIKKLSKCKSRLSRFLSLADRRRLVLAMINDVLTILAEHPYISEITVISGDSLTLAPEITEFVQVIDEKQLETVGSGLNPILAAGLEFVSKNSDSDFLVLHSDLPLLSSDDITSTVEQLSGEYDLVLGADSQEEGTNLFAFRSGVRPKFCFGPSSLQAHIKWAYLAGLRIHFLKTRSIGLDIDTEKDLQELLAVVNRGLIGKFTARLIPDLQML